MDLRVKKTFAAVAIVATTGLGLAACGSDDGSSGSANNSSDSVGKDAGTDLTKDNFFTELASAQKKAGSSHLEITVGVAGQEIQAKGDILVGETPEDSAAQIKMSLGTSGGLDLRLVDNVMYIDLGAASENKFAKVDLADADNPIAQQYGSLLDNVDPTKLVESMQDAVTGFEQKGATQKIDGVEATPFVVTVDTAKIEGLDSLPGGAQATDKLNYTVFVGPDNLQRRMVVDVAGTKMTMNYSKWGEDVSITAPGKDEISDVDLSQLAPGAS